MIGYEASAQHGNIPDVTTPYHVNWQLSRLQPGPRLRAIFPYYREAPREFQSRTPGSGLKNILVAAEVKPGEGRLLSTMASTGQAS
jgi:hypothetical protein